MKILLNVIDSGYARMPRYLMETNAHLDKVVEGLFKCVDSFSSETRLECTNHENSIVRVVPRTLRERGIESGGRWSDCNVTLMVYRSPIPGKRHRYSVIYRVMVEEK